MTNLITLSSLLEENELYIVDENTAGILCFTLVEELDDTVKAKFFYVVYPGMVEEEYYNNLAGVSTLREADIYLNVDEAVIAARKIAIEMIKDLIGKIDKLTNVFNQ